jgi:hypothetical protein
MVEELLDMQAELFGDDVLEPPEKVVTKVVPKQAQLVTGGEPVLA